MNVLKKAKEKLLSKNLTCVIFDWEKEVFSSRESGIAPVYRLVAADINAVRGMSLADKVIGRALAVILIKGGIKSCYGQVVSRPALELLTSYGIEVSYGGLTEQIMNRAGSDLCPMEKLVADHDPETAFSMIHNTLSGLSAKTSNPASSQS